MKRILAAIDFSDVTGEVIKRVSEYGRAFNSKVKVVHTEPPVSGLIYYGVDNVGYGDMLLGYGYEPMDDRAAREIKIKDDQHALDAIHKQLKANGIEAETALMPGPAGPQIINEAKAFDADLIIIGTHQHSSLYRLIFGSIRNEILDDAPCPVLFVPACKLAECSAEKVEAEQGESDIAIA